MHHALVKSPVVEKLVGYCGFGIYCLSPTLWTAWHNQAHHGNTGKPVADPDGFGTLRFWEKSAVVRALEKIAPGSGSKRSAAFLFIWFSLHSALVLLFHSQRNNYYARISRRVVYTESAAMLAFWIAVFLLVGPWSFLFIYVLPVLVANALIMSYIATNHFLNPLTEVNDPLANTLSVTGPTLVGTTAPAVRLPRRAPPLPDDERPPRPGGARRGGTTLWRPLPQHVARACPASPLHASEAARHARYV